MSIQINNPANININRQSNIKINYYPEITVVTLIFDDVYDSSLDPYNVNEWNSAIVGGGTPFTSVEVIGTTTVKLYEGKNITLIGTGVGLRGVKSITDSGAIIETGNYCFYDSTYNLISVSLPKLITAGDDCFDNCNGLTSISLPSLTTAGFQCFNNCNGLTSISLPSLVTAGDYCFDNCTFLTSISLPNTITIGNSCFYNCSGLTSISLPNTTTIGNGCFYVCLSLTSAFLPNVTYIPSDAFIVTSLSYLDISSCTDLGGTPGDDNIFSSVTLGNPFTLIANDSLRTNNPSGGSTNWPDADGDIAYLDNNTTLNVTWIV